MKNRVFQFIGILTLITVIVSLTTSFSLAQDSSWGGPGNPLTVFEVNDCFGASAQTKIQEDMPCQSYNADLYEALIYDTTKTDDNAPYADIKTFRVGADVTYLYIEWVVNATVTDNDTHNYVVEVDVDPLSEIAGTGNTASPIGDDYFKIENKDTLFDSTWKDAEANGAVEAYYDSNDDVGGDYPLTGDPSCTSCPEAAGGTAATDGYETTLEKHGYFARIIDDSVQMAIPWTRVRGTSNNHAFLSGKPDSFRVRGWTSQSSSLEKDKLQFHDAEQFSQVESGGREIDNTVWGSYGELDFGDAPDPKYPTLIASNGASHAIVQGFMLGNIIDAEADGQPNGNATGDDLANLDDEDGVTFASQLVTGPNTVQVTFTSVSGAPGFLDAWIDFNGDGDWSDAGEQIFNAQSLTTGLNNLSFNVPASYTGPTFARFRLSDQGGLTPTGFYPNGEVEDLPVPPIPELTTGILLGVGLLGLGGYACFRIKRRRTAVV